MSKGKKGLLITFSGLDGSGKSTVAGHLRSALADRQGMSPNYLWCKFGDHPFLRLRQAQAERRPSPRPTAMRRAPSWAGRIYIQVLLAYHLAVIWLKVAAPLRLGRTVICDRYVFDSIVDLQQELGCDFERARHMLTAAWIPRPDYSFYFSLPAEAAFSRKTDTASIQFLQARSQLYRKVVEVFSLRVIDASQPLEQVQEKVFSQVFQRSLSSGSLHA